VQNVAQQIHKKSKYNWEFKHFQIMHFRSVLPLVIGLYAREHSMHLRGAQYWCAVMPICLSLCLSVTHRYCFKST